MTRGSVGWDGTVAYRVDAVGARVGIIPATCRLGWHSLAAVGYRARQRDGLLSIRCRACENGIPVPATVWFLATSGALPARAELDDGPYDSARAVVKREIAAGRVSAAELSDLRARQAPISNVSFGT